MPENNIVHTHSVKCKDCYRCVSVCPVKAIKVSRGQAVVAQNRCIACGICIEECPQSAKTYRRDVEKAAELLSGTAPVGASIAPSFAAFFNDNEIACLSGTLKKLGFKYAAETSATAGEVAFASVSKASASSKPLLCSSCPSVVNYVTMYKPDAQSSLINVVSPMIAHAKKIKQILGEGAKVIFIGPCIAKKSEAEWTQNEGIVDVVLTFGEFLELLELKNISIAQSLQIPFDEEVPGASRYFPLPSGLIRAAALQNDSLDGHIYHLSGAKEVLDAVENISSMADTSLIDALFCPGGCINGPGMPDNGLNAFEKRAKIINYALKAGISSRLPKISALNLDTVFKSYPPVVKTFSEAEIEAVLKKTGKNSPEDELNCTSCGYASCREKAIAVLNGMAEIEMCVPYMRTSAESRVKKIFETSPNGIIVLDNDFNIVSINDSFKKMFNCTGDLKGQNISAVIDAKNFAKLAASADDSLNVTVNYERYNIKTHQILFKMKEDNQYVGFFTNITKSEKDIKKLDELKKRTLSKAKELLEHQIEVAQKMAEYIGENTAKGEDLISDLLALSESHDDKP
jgi:PAS domain S-box-containing protein